LTLNVPEPELQSTLLSVFVQPELIDPEAARLHLEALIPFKNPFGPSVLRCGFEACNASFHTLTPDCTLERHHIDTINKNRREHLIQAFGVRNRFEGSVNGLPQRTVDGVSPSSVHTSFHIRIVEAWAKLSREERRAIIDNETARDAFIHKTRKLICQSGRGDIFYANLEEDMRAVLPSFFSVLAEALRLDGKDDKDITVYEHDFEQKTIEAKARYELKASKMGSAQKSEDDEFVLV
jgi:hypothetical protein